MRFIVPAQITIEAASQDKALEAARAIDKLLQEPMVKSVLSANGITVRQIQVFQPNQTKS